MRTLYESILDTDFDFDFDIKKALDEMSGTDSRGTYDFNNGILVLRSAAPHYHINQYIMIMLKGVGVRKIVTQQNFNLTFDESVTWEEIDIEADSISMKVKNKVNINFKNSTITAHNNFIFDNWANGNRSIDVKLINSHLMFVKGMLDTDINLIGTGKLDANSISIVWPSRSVVSRLRKAGISVKEKYTGNIVDPSKSQNINIKQIIFGSIQANIDTIVICPDGNSQFRGNRVVFTINDKIDSNHGKQGWDSRMLYQCGEYRCLLYTEIVPDEIREIEKVSIS